jgi:small-conductance mechanosensitive channel
MALTLTDLLSYQVGNNIGKDYLMAAASFIIFIIALVIFKSIIIHRLKKLAEKTKTEFDDLLIKCVNDIRWPFYVIISLVVSLKFVALPDFIQKAFDFIAIIFVTYYAVKFIQGIIDFGANKIKQKGQEEGKFDVHIIGILNKIIKGVLWAVAVIIILSNFGYDVSALAAGLGIGGLAIAFAMQNILSDVFASFSIYFDKPFRVGDFIIVGDDLGTVKHIGIKTTRIQTLQGQELVISNKELTETRVNNYKKMQRRRIAFTFGVEYSTKLKQLKKIPGIVRDIIGKIKLADLDRVHFKQFGDFSLNFEVIYYVNTSDYNKYMDTQQEINFALKEIFEKEGIVFAFPTQTIYLNKNT